METVHAGKQHLAVFTMLKAMVIIVPKVIVVDLVILPTNYYLHIIFIDDFKSFTVLLGLIDKN